MRLSNDPAVHRSEVPVTTTPRSSEDVGVVLGTTLQAVPFQCSVSVWLMSVPLVLLKSPTAQTLLSARADTAKKASLEMGVVLGLGLGTTVQIEADAARTRIGLERASGKTTSSAENRPTTSRLEALERVIRVFEP
jgi:hypothetical protein